ncbi:MAG TPA: pyruvate flavodoxin/ferredoxin oxidoreductase [Anaerolineae bacterium]|nr:pyruvate flavodoxin/ferredoxin oxidoreductase [Anaerolineae bacterium]
MREYVDGATAIARGALKADCNFFAGYPISPATAILLHMVDALPQVGGVAIQAEDEIAAISLCIGATMTGARAMTATAGPGISLFSENIGLAIMGEVPLVIVDVQRLGPATGGATTVAQGDVQFIRWGTSGGYPIIALAPSSVPECYTLTQKAFDLAEQFRAPVFLVTDKELNLTLTTVDIDEYEDVPVRPRRIAPPPTGESKPYVPYHFETLEAVPAIAHMGDDNLARFTGSTHDERGFLTKDPNKAGRLNTHLAEKIEAHADELELVHADLQPGAETLVIGYGITARSVRDTVQIARSNAGRVSQLTVQSLWPLPARALRAAAEDVKRIVVAELNLGQYRLEIERLLPHKDVVGVNRIDGELITPEEILKKVLV